MINTFSIKEINTKEGWQPTTFFSSTPFTQSFEYGEWQKSLGYKVRRFIVEKDGETIAFFQIIFYPLFGKKTYGYIPYGPVGTDFYPELLEYIKLKIASVAKEEKSSFVRMDFSAKKNIKNIKNFFRKSIFASYIGAHFQPRYEWVLPLDKSKEEILLDMHQKTRYSIRLAEKKGIKVKIVTSNFPDHLDVFYELLSITSKRNNFRLHSRKYYEEIFSSLEESQNAFLSVATFENKVLAIDLVFIYGEIAMYMFGGSSNEYRNFCAPYLAHFEAILEAKKRGVKIYNFGGVEDPERKLYKDWETLSIFKKKFGGSLLRHSDFYDLVTEPFWYFLYNIRKFIKKK